MSSERSGELEASRDSPASRGDQVQLVFVHGPSVEPLCVEVDLGGGSAIVGRGESTGPRAGGVGILDRTTSKRHLELTREGAAYFARDLGSRNGTHVNGHPVAQETRVPVQDGDAIRLGDVLAVFRIGRDRLASTGGSALPSRDPLSGAFARGAAADPFLPGISPSMVRARARIAATAALASHVLVKGEPGTGKASAVRALLALGGVAAERVRQIDCIKLGAELGAPTDGVLVLDEIGALELAAQDAVLGAIAGSRVRVLATTSLDLEALSREGRFRAELLARLGVAESIVLPPLRARREDILSWFRRFAGREKLVLAAGAAEALVLYGWPNNLRELRAAAEGAVEQLGEDARVQQEHLPQRVAGARKKARAEEALGVPVPKAAAKAEPTREQVLAVLESCAGVMKQAAERLGISRRKLYRLCERYEIEIDAHRRPSSKID